MEDDSESSENNNIDNKSILSLNFIYKRITTKENKKDIKNNLRALNYEKIAKYKMTNMSINFLINSIFKLKNSIKKSNPIMKYINNVRPYDYSKLIQNFKNNNDILKEYYKFNKDKNKTPFNFNKSRKEKIIDLSGKINRHKNYYYTRMNNIDREKVINSRKEKIIFIQKYVRGFLFKKIFEEEVNKIIIKKFLDKILFIQENIRKFLFKKKSLNNLIINIIHNERKIKSGKITDLFCLYHYRNYYKKNLLIQKIIKQRNESILLIQKKYRAFIFIRKVKEIILKEKNVYVLNYPFNAESVQIKIFYSLNKAFKVFDFFKCPIRKYFVVYIDKNYFNQGEYLCHLIVNGKIILDKRYKYIVDKENILYNLIYIGEKKPLIEFDKNEENIIDYSYSNNKRDNFSKKKNRKKKKKIIEEEDNLDDYYYYCYNDNSNSTNSLSTKSFNEKVEKNYSNNFSNNLNKKKRNKFSIDSQSMKKENSIQSQKFQYNNILDELCPSVSSSKSNFSLNRINAYSKKTHKSKFGFNKKK